jgi:hypothetical protein
MPRTVELYRRRPAASGVQSETVKSLSDLTHAVKDGSHPTDRA